MTIAACPAASPGSAGFMSGEEKTEHQQKMEEAKEEIHQLEEDPPEKL
jgi:ribosomal protein L12E/L44/L45/RPP1/RPP2